MALTMPGRLEVDRVEPPGERGRGVRDVRVEIPVSPPVHHHPHGHEDHDEDKNGHHQPGVQGHIARGLQH